MHTRELHICWPIVLTNIDLLQDHSVLSFLVRRRHQYWLYIKFDLKLCSPTYQGAEGGRKWVNFCILEILNVSCWEGEGSRLMKGLSSQTWNFVCLPKIGCRGRAWSDKRNERGKITNGTLGDPCTLSRQCPGNKIQCHVSNKFIHHTVFLYLIFSLLNVCS